MRLCRADWVVEADFRRFELLCRASRAFLVSFAVILFAGFVDVLPFLFRFVLPSAA
jgi:hypothetical protein